MPKLEPSSHSLRFFGILNNVCLREQSIVPPKDRTCLIMEQMQADREARRKETERVSDSNVGKF